MTKEEYIKIIIDTIKTSCPDAQSVELTPETKFSDIPNMDSMSVVNFQMDLAGVIGDKANDALPLPEMSLGEYAEFIASL